MVVEDDVDVDQIPVDHCLSSSLFLSTTINAVTKNLHYRRVAPAFQASKAMKYLVF